MLFIFYLIRKCNLIWRWWSGCVCMRACVRACVRVWLGVCTQRVNRWAAGVRGRRDREPDEPPALCFFLSLSPSLLPEGQSLNPNVKQNQLIVFWFVLTLGRDQPAASQPNTPKKTLQTSSFSAFQSRLSQQGLKCVRLAVLRVDLAFY